MTSCQRTQKHRHLIAGCFLPLDERASDYRGLADDAFDGDRFSKRKVTDQHEEERLDFNEREAEATERRGREEVSLDVIVVRKLTHMQARGPPSKHVTGSFPDQQHSFRLGKCNIS